MRACANCGHENRPGVFFCENCGASLIGKLSRDSNSLPNDGPRGASEAPADAEVVSGARVEGRALIREGDRLKLEIEGSPEPIVVSAAQEIIFGRRDPATGALPDVDLTPHAGYRMGVSRRHAAIRQGTTSTLDIWDLGSSNGTFLNGQRLSAHRPYRLHDGDELRLGQMVIRVRFEPESERARLAPKPAESAAAPGPALEAESPQKEPPSTEPIYALIAMLREQDAAAESSSGAPTTEPLPEVAAPPVGEKPAETSDGKARAEAPAEKPAEAPQPPADDAADKLATEEAAPAATGPAESSGTAAPASVPDAPPIAAPTPLPKSSNGPTPAEAKQVPSAVPVFPPGEAPASPRNGQPKAKSAAPASDETAEETTTQANPEASPPAEGAASPDEKDPAQPPAPPSPAE